MHPHHFDRRANGAVGSPAEGTVQRIANGPSEVSRLWLVAIMSMVYLNRLDTEGLCKSFLYELEMLKLHHLIGLIQ